MSLADRVVERVSEQLLVNLTNQGATGTATVDTTFLGYVTEDVEGLFEAETGVAYDETNRLHVAVCVDGTLSRLHELTGNTGRNVEKVESRWKQGLIRVATTEGSERRLLPGTNSTLEPSTEREGAQPDMDRSRWADYVPDMNGSTADAEVGDCDF